MKLGNLRIDNPFVQAPMAGVTDYAFREVARRFHFGLIFTEMISAEGLCRGNWKTMHYTRTTPEHRPVSLQLVGRDPERMAEAAVRAETMEIDFIDINAGCPQVRIAATGSGGAMLKDPEKLVKIVSAVKNAVSLPVSVKMRLGYSKDQSLELATLVRDAGADFITVHGRTVAQKFTGKSDWQAIKKVVDNMDIPVLANGDVRSEADAVALLERTGAAGVMMGRATRGRPDFLGTAYSLLESGKFERMSPELLASTILDHARIEQELFGELSGMKRMRKHVTWYFKAAGIKFDSQLIYSLETIADLENVLNKCIPAKP
ncbi:MAG: tRNA dihydrouridine synthase DusB [Candidatus Thermoplasmatota archaeon]|nr:tRNA dihydrouridine synthase DusB [Euryarchaeota archaeon]MBU4031961.1 tRNA dihydrouridine synthase DusB [Candidatus Thermoplasmatota archaeon]MBU4071194.1 tRNA dihydrouridine synthase DusB [Candidatus Thermoplasmatota archaeon]MBU4143605.1 tRNA dihydrouridine synthase DusB [Candidatus Thermoplasmatota archaeon]MBU4591342.1 tRNA dihydrouridine synthase DusB [Candidatus Thermoplasmatota archaeon]